MKQLLSLLAVLFAVGAEAQLYPSILNGSFEQWQPMTGPAGSEMPAGWKVNSSAIFPTTQLVPLVSKSTDATHGSYSLVMRPRRASSPQQPSPNVNSVFVLDSVWSRRIFPKALRGKYKLMGDTVLNSADITVCFRSSASLNACSAAVGMIDFAAASQWTPFSITIDSLLAAQAQPTTGAIYISLSSRDSSASPSSQLMVDSLHWVWGDTTTSVGDAVSAPPLATLYPNPAASTIHFILSSREEDAWRISLYTLQGQKVKATTIKKGKVMELSVADLPNGTYYYTIAGEKTRRFGSGPVTISR